ncbi:putative methanogenesis regulatory protein FilR2 [ANME-1 cluster archaeon GoMg1]|nr:putative methanogenesis regulatory protein FilR2 [ANME-1 cluster archaeon GoMg1]VUT25271.1 MAG: transcriptional regulator NarL [Candidatus Methanolliviera sp. GoM_asphalt]
MEELRPATILLVEDDPGDQKLIKVSLKSQKIANELYIVGSGEEAMDFLYHRGKHSAETPLPDRILLDLKMPGMGGKEFLRRIKQDEKMKKIQVVILTSSDSEKDILDSYNLQASGYIKKPVELGDFKRVMKEIEAYWFIICKLPPKEE